MQTGGLFLFVSASGATLTGWGTPLASLEAWRVASPTPRLNTKAGFINSISYSLPKYYFQDLAAEVMDEIMRGMEAALPEPSWEEIDQWLNTTTSSRLFPVWYVHRTGCRLCASALRHPETP